MSLRHKIKTHMIVKHNSTVLCIFVSGMNCVNFKLNVFNKSWTFQIIQILNYQFIFFVLKYPFKSDILL